MIILWIIIAGLILFPLTPFILGLCVAVVSVGFGAILDCVEWIKGGLK